MAKGSTFLAVRELGALRPVEETGEALLSRIKVGKLVEVEIRAKRNLELHRLYWVLLHLVYNNLPEETAFAYPNIEKFHDQMKIICGVGERWEVEKDFVDPTGQKIPAGTVVYKPGSIAFHKMNDLEFIQFFEAVCLVVIKWFLPGVTIQQLRYEVERMTGSSIETAVAKVRERRLKMEAAGEIDPADVSEYDED